MKLDNLQVLKLVLESTLFCFFTHLTQSLDSKHLAWQCQECIFFDKSLASHAYESERSGWCFQNMENTSPLRLNRAWLWACTLRPNALPNDFKYSLSTASTACKCSRTYSARCIGDSILD